LAGRKKKNLIKVVDLKKSYKRLEVLKGISFDVKKGSVFGFIGKNGAGKTTTMNILTGLLRFESGQILIKGMDFSKNKIELLKSIGYLPENPVFYEYMNAYEYLNFIGEITGVEIKKLNFDISNLLKAVNLKIQAKRRISGYSRGMKQRLALAAAIIHEPDILFLDEPASALDPEGRLEMLALLEELKRLGKTIFLSTHILNDAERVCDEVCIIDEGRILLDEKLSDLYDKYIQPVFDIEFEKGLTVETEIFRKLSWVESIKACGKIINLSVNNIKIGRAEILKVLYGMDNYVTSFQIRKSSLEDIFINITNQGREVK
jgi:ABC-2 type transport system ATP-binding protein